MEKGDELGEAIENNGTRELVSLPDGAKRTGVKWIYKAKYNEEGKLEKHKVRLAKEYSQQHGVDYSKVFASVAGWDTIRTIIVVALIRGWFIFQLDVKIVFLHGELNEGVFTWLKGTESYF